MSDELHSCGALEPKDCVCGACFFGYTIGVEAKKGQIYPEIEVKKGQIYQHYKGGVYTIVGLATHTETNEVMVVYQAVDKNLPTRLWVRPLSIFLGDVYRVNEFTPMCKRFTLMEK